MNKPRMLQLSKRCTSLFAITASTLRTIRQRTGKSSMTFRLFRFQSNTTQLIAAISYVCRKMISNQIYSAFRAKHLPNENFHKTNGSWNSGRHIWGVIKDNIIFFKSLVLQFFLELGHFFRYNDSTNLGVAVFLKSLKNGPPSNNLDYTSCAPA